MSKTQDKYIRLWIKENTKPEKKRDKDKLERLLVKIKSFEKPLANTLFKK